MNEDQSERKNAVVCLTSSDMSEICTSAPLHLPNTRMSAAVCSRAGSSVSIISVMMSVAVLVVERRRRCGSRTKRAA